MPVEGISYTGPTREQFEGYARKDAERALRGLRA